MTEKQFKKDEVIFREGEDGKSLYQITDGTIGIFVNYGASDEHKLTELKKGQFFGEMAVIEMYPRSATAVALDDAKAIEIGLGDISDYFSSNPDNIVNIMKHLSSRIRSLTSDYTEVSDTIAELHLGDQDKSKRSTSLVERIKKFAGVYSSNRKMSKLSSVESQKKISRIAHSEGFNKKVESYPKGTVIFKEGETGDCMYDIHFGRIGIYKDYGTPNEKLLTTLSANQFFGEMGMLENEQRSATAVVLDDNTTLETITADDLKELFDNNPPKLEMILAHISYRLRKLTNEYMGACKLIFDVCDAEASGSVSDDLKNKADSYSASFYD